MLVEQMRSRIIFAVLLGAMVGFAIGYSPQVQQAVASRPLLMQETAQPNVAFSPLRPSVNPIELLLPVATALAVAIPVFLVAKAKTK